MKPISTLASHALGRAVQGQGAEKSAAAGSVAKANATATSTAAQSGIARLVAEGAPIDQDRIAEIREALANGSYVIDTEKLAQKMIEFDLGR